MKILDLTSGIQITQQWPLASPDPIKEKDALYEATLLGAIYTRAPAIAGLLFDLRTALHFNHELNTGVLVVHDVQQMNIPKYEWMILYSYIAVDKRLTQRNMIHVSLGDGLGGHVDVVGTSIEFFAGFVEGIGEVAARLDKDNNYQQFRRTVQHWDSEIELRAASSFDT